MSYMMEFMRILALNLCFLALVLGFCQILLAKCATCSWLARTQAKLLISLLVFGFGNIKILGWSVLEYYYAFFGAPCALSVGLSAVYVLHAFGVLQARILPFGVALLWAGFGTILYLGVLALLPFDIYYVDSLVQILVVCAMLVLAFMCSRVFGILGALGLWWNLLGGIILGDEVAIDTLIYESVIDVGLYALCVGLVLARVLASMNRIWRKIRTTLIASACRSKPSAR